VYKGLIFNLIIFLGFVYMQKWPYLEEKSQKSPYLDNEFLEVTRTMRGSKEQIFTLLADL
jgi:hypothetical protein